MARIWFIIFSIMFIAACDKIDWNNPHKAKDARENYMYASFSESPKTLDPASSYSADEVRFNAQIYEPLLQYDYFSRPYKLVPLTAEQMPIVTFLDKNKKIIPATSDIKDIAYSVYDIKIKPGIQFQPHPAFAKNENGEYRYLKLSGNEIGKIKDIHDFKYAGTRELTVDDYIYEIKRLASPKLSSSIYGLMSKHIEGFSSFHENLKKANGSGVHFLDLRCYKLSGVKKTNDYEMKITLTGKYPQFLYWLAMTFFAPVPWEVDAFYSQPGMAGRNITLSWYPVGTGPYMLVENNPNKEMVLQKNPNFHGEKFPDNGAKEDREKGYMVEAGKRMPFVDKFIYTLEKESIPRWTKFLQGYYDNSAIGSDSFDQAIQIDQGGNADLTPEMKAKGIRLQTVVQAGIFYLGFNMLDPVVGGSSDQARKLRQAISIVVDYKEFISIFLNGRGLRAQGPIPPGIFGYSNKKNPIANQSIERAKQLLAEAGYPGGVNAKTGLPLVLHYDVAASSGPDDKARFDWMRKQFEKLGIQLNVRSTQYNRFQKKIRTGNVQIFFFGWMADYPDAENFLFLLYGPNGQAKFGGQNSANYNNPEFNALFEKMKNMDNTEERKKIINKMIQIVQEDAPWVFAINPKDFILSQQWVEPIKPSTMANNTAKYIRIDPKVREKLQKKWNQPVTWPLGVVAVFVIVSVIPVIVSYTRRQRRAVKNRGN